MSEPMTVRIEGLLPVWQHVDGDCTLARNDQPLLSFNNMDFLSFSWLTTEWLTALLAIVLIDLVLAGDNAVIIALACRKLPPEQRRLGILYGSLGAVVLRVILIFFAMALLATPFLKIVGAALLLWIGFKLLQPQDEDAHSHIEGAASLWAAVKTVIVADLVMSFDNVIAIAGAAEAGGGENEMALVIIGLLISIPMIVWGSKFVLALMDRFPIVITAGGVLLGWLAGTMAVSDPVLADATAWTWAPKLPQTDAVRYGAGLLGAVVVYAIGSFARRSASSSKSVNFDAV